MWSHVLWDFKNEAGTPHLATIEPLLNPEGQFRCINLSRLSLIWIVQYRFLCNKFRPLHGSDQTALIFSYHCRSGTGEETRGELSSHVGRLLWESCWGSFAKERIVDGLVKKP